MKSSERPAGYPANLPIPLWTPFQDPPEDGPRIVGVYGKKRLTSEEAQANREAGKRSGSVAAPFSLTQAALVWHYTDQSGALGMIQNGEIWATSAESLNDAGELHYGVRQIIQEAEEATLTARGHWKSRLKELVSALQTPSASSGRVFVACASTMQDSLSQWRAYGGDQTGCALGLEARSKLAVIGTQSGDIPVTRQSASCRGWLQVEYALEAQRTMARDALAIALRFAGRCSTEDLVSELLVTALCLKHPAFHDEREVRYVAILSAAETDCVHFRSGRYGITPYVRMTSPAQPIEADGTIVEVVNNSGSLPLVRVSVGPSRNQRSAVYGLRQLLDRRGGTRVDIDGDEVPYRG